MRSVWIGVRAGAARPLVRVAIAASLALAVSWPARGDLLLSTNGGGITFGVSPAGAPQAGAPVFDPFGALLSAGSGYPLQGPATPPVQSFFGGYTNAGGNLAGAGIAAVANPAAIAPGFGTGATALRAAGGPAGGGIFWTQGSVSDPLANGVASLNISKGTAEFIQANTPLTGNPGVYLSVAGSLGNQPGAYVEAALDASFVLARAGGGPPITLGIINVTIASDGPGALPDFVSANSFTRFNGAGANTFTAAGVSLLPAITLNPGDVLFMDGTLTLLADPPMSDVIFQLNPLPFDAPIPTFGVGAAPEPSSIALLVAGAVAVSLRRHRRRRGPVATTDPQPGEVTP